MPARGLSFRGEGSPYPSGIYGPGPGNTTSSLRTRIYQTGGGGKPTCRPNKAVALRRRVVG